MANGIEEIISQLEKQRDAIDRALAALREVDGGSAPAPVAAKPAAPRKAAVQAVEKAAVKKRKGGMSPEGKERLIAALKARWAAKKASEAVVTKVPGKRGRPRKTA